jgi:hypothetical protein
VGNNPWSKLDLYSKVSVKKWPQTRYTIDNVANRTDRPSVSYKFSGTFYAH